MAEPARLAEEFLKLLTTQDYAPRPKIEGVVLHDLARFVEDGGEFSEVARLTEAGELPPFPGFKVRQVNHSVVMPGTIKAWHVHRSQEDVWFVPPPMRLLVGLLDCREGSPTKGVSTRLVLGDGKARLLLVPRGVAHGVANVGPAPAILMYFVNQRFDAQAPDEHRLPWDLLGADFWRIAPG